MSLQFILGPACSGKSEYLKNLVIDESLKNPGKKYLFIVPDQYTLQTQKSMICKHPNKAFSNIEVLNFSRLSHRVLEEVGGEEIPVLDDTGKSLIIRHITENIRESLSVFERKIDKIGFVHEVKSAISEFMQYGISPDGVRELIEYSSERPSLSYKLKDLSVIYDAFMQYKGDSFRTREETLQVVKDNIYKSELIKDSVICFDGFTGFTPIQERVIEELLKYADRILLSFDMEEGMNPYHIEGEQELFYLSKKTIDNLKRIADSIGVPEDNPVMLGRRRTGGQLVHLEKNLFRYPFETYKGNESRLHIYCAERIRDEITDTCQRIKTLTCEKDYRYSDIAVVVGNLSAYADDFAEIAGAFDIPVYMDYSRSVLLLPFIEAIRSAYDVCEYDFTAETVIRHIRLGFGPLNAEECDELENYLIRTGIRGYSAYKRYWDVSYYGKKEESDEKKEARLKKAERLNSYRERIAVHFSRLMQKDATVKEHSAALYGFFEDIDAENRLGGMAEMFRAQNDMDRAYQYAQLFPKICDLLDQIVLLIGDERMNRNEYREILEAGLGEIKLGIIPQEADRVLVGDIERTRLSDIKALFFLGANDGNIPSAISSGGIISDLDKEYLKQSDKQLAPTPRDQMFIQRLYLYMNLSKPSDELNISFAQMDVEGKSIRRSYLIGMLLNLFPDTKVEKSESTHTVDGRRMPAGKHLIEMELAAYMREYALGRLDDAEKEYLKILAESIIDKGCDEIYEQITDASFAEYSNESMAKEIAAALYGKALEVSVSRIEKYAACAYAHFLMYGLGLKEREEFSFEYNNTGDVFHRALEQFANRLKEENIGWEEYSSEQADKWVEEILNRIAATYKDTIMLSSNRRVAMTRRMSRILKRTVDSLQYQIGKGKFVPTEFEKRFYEDRTIRSENDDEIKLIITGVIDRVDVCNDAETGDEYIRIVDYKTGSKTYDIEALYYGLSLQLTVYMKQAMRLRREQARKKGVNTDIKPGGMLYQKIFDPVVEAKADSTDEEICRERRKQMKLSGVLPMDRRVVVMNDTELNNAGVESDVFPVGIKLDDSFTSKSAVMSEEALDIVLKYADFKLEQLAGEVMEGNVSVEPGCIKSKTEPCTYCIYKSICKIDSELPGYGVRTFEHKDEDGFLIDMRDKL